MADKAVDWALESPDRTSGKGGEKVSPEDGGSMSEALGYTRESQ
jgi:hypothetical protein